MRSGGREEKGVWGENEFPLCPRRLLFSSLRLFCNRRLGAAETKIKTI
jgi:hypothetical protein